MKELILKFIKFGIVGISGVIIDFGVTYICKESFKMQKYLANSLGFSFATVSNFFLNRHWTFESHDPAAFQQFGKFSVIAVIGLVLSNLIIYILNDKWKMKFYGSKIFAIAMVSVWNFFANYIYTFAY